MERAADHDRYHVYYVEYHDDHATDDYGATVVLDHRCTDDDCGDEHYHVFTTDDLAARDAANYDAGYDRGVHYGAAVSDLNAAQYGPPRFFHDPAQFANPRATSHGH